MVVLLKLAQLVLYKYLVLVRPALHHYVRYDKVWRALLVYKMSHRYMGFWNKWERWYMEFGATAVDTTVCGLRDQGRDTGYQCGTYW